MTMQEADEWEWNGLANVGGVTVASVGQMQFWWANDFRKPFSRLHFRLDFLEWFSQGEKGHKDAKMSGHPKNPAVSDLQTTTLSHTSALHP